MPTYNPYTSGASKLAWPSLLADKLNQSCYNFGTAGASNKEILWRFQHVLPDIKPNDTVAFLWSFFDRHCVIREEFEKTYDVSKGRTKNSNGKNLKLEKIYNDSIAEPHDMYVSNWTRIHYAHLACKAAGVNSYHMLSGFSLSPSYREVAGARPNDWTPAFLNTDDINIVDVAQSKFYGAFPFALDNDHPGPEGHSNISNLFWRLINNENSRLK